MKTHNRILVFIGALLILVLGFGLIFLRGQEGRDQKGAFLLFCDKITSESLTIASIGKGFGVEGITKELSNRDKEKLVDLLKTISPDDLRLEKEGPDISEIEVYLFLRTSSQEYAMQFVLGKGIYVLSAKLNDEQNSSYSSKVLWLDASLLEEYMLSYF